jgi:SAM-dependent methyltransferase
VDVTRDGSPVDAYLRLPAGDAPQLIHDAIPAGATVLDLGCGVGRLATPLARLGHPVTGVDESPEMLRHARDIETVEARIEDLDLARSFGAVLLASHFLNAPVAELRRRWLGVCRRHVSDAGVVLIERYPPGWPATAVPETRTVNGMEVELHDLERGGDVLAAAFTYRIGTSSWTQRFTTTDMDDDLLSSDARSAGLELVRSLDDRRTWVLLRPAAHG